MEDSIFAGHLSKKLLESKLFISDCDSVLMSQKLNEVVPKDLFSFLDQSSHRKRLKSPKYFKISKVCEESFR